MPSTVIMFWCTFCTVKENRCWFGNPFALSSVCLLGVPQLRCIGLHCDFYNNNRSTTTSTCCLMCDYPTNRPTTADDDGRTLYHSPPSSDRCVLARWPWRWWPWLMCLWLMSDDPQSSRAPSVEDDDEGHLIYRSGDVLQDRCSWILLLLHYCYYT